MAYRTVEAYLALFAKAGNAKAIGEASTPYLVSPESPARIRAVYPEARIIIILRNPVDRAYSLWRFLCAHGLEWIGTFEAALAAEDARAEGSGFRGMTPFWDAAYLYVRTGLYSTQLQRYLAAFPAGQIQVILSDDLQDRPENTTHGAWRFLGLESTPPIRVSRRNKSEFPLSVSVQNLLARHWSQHPLREPCSRVRLIDKFIRRAIAANNYFGRARRRRMEAATRRRLVELYRDDIENTALLIDRNLGAWLELPER
jgi:hypothetical protein